MNKLIPIFFFAIFYILLSTTQLFAQQFPTPETPNNSQIVFKPKTTTLKAVGDTLYYQDFAGGLPLGWSIVNNNPNIFQWTWDTVYRPGQFSAQFPTTITSTTASDGFMLLAADSFNTPIPVTGAVAMDTYFESPNIIITPNCAVWISFQQSLRYCCNPANRLVMQVSTDNFQTFTEFDATAGLPVNLSSGTHTNVINVNSALSNVSNFKVRFLSEGNTHYYWMIDDFTVIEGPIHDMAMTSASVGFNPSYAFNPFYFQIPSDFITPLSFSSTILNNGCKTTTNAFFRTSIVHDSFPNGNSGTGLVQTLSSNPTPSLFPSSTVTDTTVNSMLITNSGKYTIQLTALSDSIDQFPGNETITYKFQTTDTTVAKDDGVFSRQSRTGPHYFITQAQNSRIENSIFGSKFIIESQSGNGGFAKIPTSISLRVYLDSNYGATEIIPKVWPIDSNLAIQAPVASSFAPYTISTTSVIDTFITLALDIGSAVTGGLPNGEYVVGYEIVSTTGNGVFDILDNKSGIGAQPFISCLVNTTMGAPNWSWINANPGIRLNFGNLPIPTALKHNSLDSNSNIGILPNPNHGEFSIHFKGKSKDYQLRVINSIGQSVFESQINGGKNTKRPIDLRFLENGIYYLLLENETERLVEMIVIN